ncbi:MAG: polynucleotide adenylyltransferase [Clostridia bacterium]|nr:polynucleotide adenylyltransferase [Clostridia bacterium]
MKFKIPASAEKVIAELEKRGFEAYIVGGCVRDTLLKKEPNDWDVTTSALPEQTLEIFSALDSFKAIPTGITHGTVTVVHGGVPIEVTTYRIDGEYSDSRHPDSVEFTDKLHADLARRDFTVNAMAYSPERGLVDLYGGVCDLENGIIRCVGDPHERFREDALRILRALRFSATLDFMIEDVTAKAAILLSGLLAHVSRERIASELSRLVCGKGASRVIRDFLPIIKGILPGVNFAGLDKICTSLDNLFPASTPLGLAAIFADCEPSDVHESLRSLRFDSATVSLCTAIVTHLHGNISTAADVKRLCRDIGYGAAEDVIKLGIARGEMSSVLTDLLSGIIERDECVSLAQLKIGGDELVSLGAKGREIGMILSGLLEKVIDGTLQNDKTPLLLEAVNIINRKG